MRSVGARAIGVLSLAALSTAFASSCAAPPRTNTDAQSSVKSVAPSRHIAQLDFGGRAAFASCLPPACPVITPKTLAIEVLPALPASRPIEPTAALDRSENHRIEVVVERDTDVP
jgi:hypothetical protein